MTQLVVRHYAKPAAKIRLWAGIFMAVVAIAFGIEQSAQWLAAHPMAARASLLAGLATGLGALPILFLRRPSASLMGPMLGLAVGMMLAASVFSLLVPAIQMVADSAAPWVLAPFTVLAFLGGIRMMQRMDHRFPHAHVEIMEADAALPQVGLVVAAIALHNLPEGLAVGVAAASGADHVMTLGIALQNIPEGWVVASALLALGAAPLRAAFIALATGLIEPLGGLFGVIAGAVAGDALPLALAAAAGAMLWVVAHELIPAAYRSGRTAAGSAGLASGFAAMAALAAFF